MIRNRRHLPVLLLLVLLAAGMLGFVWSKHTLPSQFEQMPPGALSWTECPLSVPLFTAVHCAWLSPEPGVKIPVAIIRRSLLPREFRPLLFINGGPGASTIDFSDGFAGWAEWLQGLNVERDLVVFDFAGTGFAEPEYDCPDIGAAGREVLAQNLSGREEAQIYFDLYRDCHDALLAQGRDLSRLTLPAMVRTTRALLDSMPMVDWDIYSISYGTRVGLGLMREQPANLGRVVLDSVYPPQARGLTDMPRLYHQALDRLFSACEDDKWCEGRYPDLRQEFYRMLETLDEEPLRIRHVGWPSYLEVTTVINSRRMVDLVYMAMYDWDRIQILPGALWQASHGDASGLVPLIDVLYFFYTDPGFGDMLYQTVACSERAPEESMAAVRERWRDYPQLAPYMIGGYELDVCDVWSVASMPERYRRPVSSDVPTLILAGELDPVTPPEYARETARTLSRVRLEQYSGIGHDVEGSDDCATELVGLFLEDRKPSADYDLYCTERDGPDFWAP